MVLAGVALSVMRDVQAARLPEGHVVPLMVGVLLWLYGAAVAVFGEVRRVRSAVLEPERRIVDALRAMRGGDLSFRLHLRRNEVLQDVAGELNALLDWLNSSPPSGSQVGGDIVHLEEDEEEAGSDDADYQSDKMAPDIPRIVCAESVGQKVDEVACS